jgi:uncharacterized UPF0160 family protein
MITIVKPETAMNFEPKTSRDIYVVTHDGVFHSDEVFSVALLHLFHKNIFVTRTRNKQILANAVNNPDTFVLDVGGEYDPGKRNFDHHQKEAPEGLSTISLLFFYLFPDYETDKELLKLYQRLITGINEWDQGKADRIMRNHPLHLPQVISGFNRFGTPGQDEQFLKAVDFAYQILGNELNTAGEIVRSEKIWEKKKILSDDTVILPEFCMFWRSVQGEKPQFKYIVQPGEKNWSIMSVDSHLYPLPETTEKKDEGVVFRHKDRFVIVFEDFKSTIQYVNNHILSSQKSLTP